MHFYFKTTIVEKKYWNLLILHGHWEEHCRWLACSFKSCRIDKTQPNQQWKAWSKLNKVNTFLIEKLIIYPVYNKTAIFFFKAKKKLSKSSFAREGNKKENTQKLLPSLTAQITPESFKNQASFFFSYRRICTRHKQHFSKFLYNVIYFITIWKLSLIRINKKEKEGKTDHHGFWGHLQASASLGCFVRVIWVMDTKKGDSWVLSQF